MKNFIALLSFVFITGQALAQAAPPNQNQEDVPMAVGVFLSGGLPEERVRRVTLADPQFVAVTKRFGGAHVMKAPPFKVAEAEAENMIVLILNGQIVYSSAAIYSPEDAVRFIMTVNAKKASIIECFNTTKCRSPLNYDTANNL